MSCTSYSRQWRPYNAAVANGMQRDRRLNPDVVQRAGEGRCLGRQRRLAVVTIVGAAQGCHCRVKFHLQNARQQHRLLSVTWQFSSDSTPQHIEPACALSMRTADAGFEWARNLCATVAKRLAQEAPRSTQLPPSHASGCAGRDGHDAAVTALLQPSRGMPSLLNTTDVGVRCLLGCHHHRMTARRQWQTFVTCCQKLVHAAV